MVALESTVITHGLPSPGNLETALALESLVRDEGVLPATVGVIEGELIVGLEERQLELLARSPAEKASLWNLATLLSQKANAGTTVASTLFTAAKAGVSVFATGGLGGVHPQPFDESADLLALSRHSVLTVCSGPKSILLAGATLERLETLAVPVVGFRSQRLAGFHVPETEHRLPVRLDTPAEVASAFRKHLELGLSGGMVVSNPVSQGLDRHELDQYRKQAEREADTAAVTGKEVTPFLLERLAQLSNGRTVEINLRLLRENARLAARIARSLQPSAQLLATDRGAQV